MSMKLLLLVLFLTGCASSHKQIHSSIRKDMILPVGAVREELRQDQVFLAPVPIKEPMPTFPDDYPAGKDLEANICVELVISAEGTVDGVTQIAAAPDCERAGSANSVLLYPQVAAAVNQWTYFGAAICTFDESEDECSASN
jgi:hypothetical protein